MRIGIGKDGGPESTVTGAFLEFKRLFSVVLLRFDGKSREAFHTHAFNAVSVLLKGTLHEYTTDGKLTCYHAPALIYTPRDRFHMVDSLGKSYVLSFRGPWREFWHEFVDGRLKTLTHGRRER